MVAANKCNFNFNTNNYVGMGRNSWLYGRGVDSVI